MFSNSGIHIYDIKLDGNNNSGKLGFKLRKNEDIKDILLTAGVQNKQLSFLFVDTQIINEQML